MQYQFLSADQEAQIIQDRLIALEAEHFGHTLNLGRVAAAKVKHPDKGAELDAEAARIQADVDVIENAYAADSDALAKVKAKAPGKPTP